MAYSKEVQIANLIDELERERDKFEDLEALEQCHLIALDAAVREEREAQAHKDRTMTETVLAREEERAVLSAVLTYAPPLFIEGDSYERDRHAMEKAIGVFQQSDQRCHALRESANARLLLATQDADRARKTLHSFRDELSTVDRSVLARIQLAIETLCV